MTDWDCTCIAHTETIRTEITGPLSARVTVRTRFVIDPDCPVHGEGE